MSHDRLQRGHPDCAPMSSKEADWWYLNSMSRYNKNSASTSDDLFNTILLRADLHIAFDNPKFVFVPKPFSLRSPQLVTHLVEASGVDSWWRITWIPQMMASSHERNAHSSRGHGLSPKKRKTDAQALNDSDVSYSAGEEEESSPRKRRQLSNRTLDVPTAHHSESLEPSQNSSHSPDLLNEISQSEKIESSLSTSDTFSSPHLLGHSNRDVGPTADTSANVALAQTWLAKERLRSDPSEQWKKDKAWADEEYYVFWWECKAVAWDLWGISLFHIMLRFRLLVNPNH